MSESNGRGVALVNVHEGAAAALVTVVAASAVVAAADVSAAVTVAVVTVFVAPLEVLCHEFHAGRGVGSEDHLRSVLCIALPEKFLL